MKADENLFPLQVDAICLRVNEAGAGKVAQLAQIDKRFLPAVDTADMTRQHPRVSRVFDVAYQRHSNIS